jgi:hypothetical protein
MNVSTKTHVWQNGDIFWNRDALAFLLIRRGGQKEEANVQQTFRICGVNALPEPEYTQ